MRKLYYGIPFEELNFKKIDIEKWASKIIGLDLHCDDLPSKSDGGYVGPPGQKASKYELSDQISLILTHPIEIYIMTI